MMHESSGGPDGLSVATSPIVHTFREMGLVAQRCPHRGASLAYGIPEVDGLRCAYHGWVYNPDGQCIEQPAEPRPFCERIKLTRHKVESYACYLAEERSRLERGLAAASAHLREKVEQLAARAVPDAP